LAFRNGHASDDLAEAGLLVKVIDGMEDEAAQPWHACLTGWCGFVDHVSFSLVNAQLPHMYTEAGNKPDVGAFVHSHLTSWCNGQPCSNLYNEVVMPKVDYEAALPHSIRAVFCTRSATCDDARDVHTRFLQRRTT